MVSRIGIHHHDVLVVVIVDCSVLLHSVGGHVILPENFCGVQDTAAETSAKMGTDLVMHLLLSGWCQNVCIHAAWSDVLEDPRFEPAKAQLPVIPDLNAVGKPTGFHMRLDDYQAGISALLHAGGYPGCTAHGGFATDVGWMGLGCGFVDCCCYSKLSATRQHSAQDVLPESWHESPVSADPTVADVLPNDMA